MGNTLKTLGLAWDSWGEWNLIESKIPIWSSNLGEMAITAQGDSSTIPRTYEVAGYFGKGLYLIGKRLYK